MGDLHYTGRQEWQGIAVWQIFAGVERSGATIAIPFCRSNSRGRWLSAGSYEPIAEKVFHALNADAFLLEYDDERSG